MTANPQATPGQACAPLRSTEAYVLPHLIDVNAGAHGILTSVDLVPHAVVRRGQAVATLEPPAPRRDDGQGAVVVKAPVTGLVTSCWATVGEMVRRSSPLACIASSENVLVSARFPAGCSGSLARGSVALVLDGSAREPIPATVVSVIAPAEWGLLDGLEEARSTRVVLSLPTAPAEVLWPGTPVQVVIGG